MTRAALLRRDAIPGARQLRDRPGSGDRSPRAAVRTTCAALGLAALACGGGSTERFRTDLVQMLDLAESTAESAELRPGDYEQRHELLEGWSAPEEREWGTFAIGQGARSSLNWRLSWTRPLELVLTGRQLAADGNEQAAVVVSWNGEALGRLELTSKDGLAEHRLRVPAAVQKQGDNHVLLDYSSPAGGPPPKVAWSRRRRRETRPG